MLPRNIFFIASILLAETFYSLAASDNKILNENLRNKLNPIIVKSVMPQYDKALKSIITVFNAVLEDVKSLLEKDKEVKMRTKLFTDFILKVNQPLTVFQKHQLLQKFQEVVDRNKDTKIKDPSTPNLLFSSSLEKNLLKFESKEFLFKYDLMYKDFTNELNKFWKGVPPKEQAENKNFQNWYDHFINEKKPMMKFTKFGKLLDGLE